MLNEAQIESIRHYFQDKPVLKAWLFGSYARDESEAESDIDLLIRPDYSQRLGWGFFSFRSDLQKILGKQVDVVSEGFLKDFARSSVENDKKLIYERSERCYTYKAHDAICGAS